MSLYRYVQGNEEVLDVHKTIIIRVCSRVLIYAARVQGLEGDWKSPGEERAHQRRVRLLRNKVSAAPG
jgi:hypothetical protein